MGEITLDHKDTNKEPPRSMVGRVQQTAEKRMRTKDTDSHTDNTQPIQFPPLCYSSLRIRACQPTSSFTSTFPQSKISSSQCRDDVCQHVVPPVIFRFPDRDYKSVATQISHDAGLSPIPYTGRKFLPIEDRTSVSSYSTISRQHAINHVTTGMGCPR